MSDRSQTLSVEIDRDLVEAFLAIEPRWSPHRRLNAILRAALSQPEHQGSEDAAFLQRVRAYVNGETSPGGHGEDLIEGQEEQKAILALIDSRLNRPPQPPAPVLSDEEREHLQGLAYAIEDGSVASGKEAGVFLRNLASREHRGEED